MASILPDSESRLWLHKFDKCIRESIASRGAELEGLRGVRFLIHRLKIELWAWRRAFRKARPHDRFGLFVLALCLLPLCGCSTERSRTVQVSKKAAEAQAIDSTVNDRSNWIFDPARPSLHLDRP